MVRHHHIPQSAGPKYESKMVEQLWLIIFWDFLGLPKCEEVATSHWKASCGASSKNPQRCLEASGPPSLPWSYFHRNLHFVASEVASPGISGWAGMEATEWINHIVSNFFDSILRFQDYNQGMIGFKPSYIITRIQSVGFGFSCASQMDWWHIL